MRILVATDAWHPQVNGVVRSLEMTVNELEDMGHTVTVLDPQACRTIAMPGYREIKLAIRPRGRVAAAMDAFAPDAVHIPVEGPIGWAARAECRKRDWRFTTSFHTRVGTYLRQRYGLPEGLAFAWQRQFHNAGAGLMVQADTLEEELAARGFKHLVRWGRGVDTGMFRPFPQTMDLPRPVFGYIGRVSAEKNIEAFLGLDLPGSKMVVGDGPARAALERQYPNVHWAGYQTGAALARHYAELDVFVLPSRFETFGLVVLEALACGTPVAAYPVHGPIDIIGDAAVGVMDEDLGKAALGALDIPRDQCRAFAETFSWRAATEQFLNNLVPIGTA